MQEATAGDLLRVAMAWPLARRLRDKQRFSTERLGLVDRSLRLDRFAVFAAHDFVIDRMSERVTARTKFEQTFARPIRPKTDHELPSEVADAVAHDTMPQFTLRNIGRAERNVDLDDPLPFKRKPGLHAGLSGALDEVRAAKVPKPEMAQIWSVEFVKRTRASFRRLLIEDPWELRYGPEATSVHDGIGRTYIVEGTHPDDMPGAQWGPQTIPMPPRWIGPPPGEAPMPQPRDIAEEMREIGSQTEE